MALSVPEISVVIVGAGPTGLTLACDLVRRNVDFRLIDKAPAYFPGSRGKGLQPRSLEVLDDLGVIDRILSHGRFHLPFRGYDGATILGDRDPYEASIPRRMSLTQVLSSFRNGASKKHCGNCSRAGVSTLSLPPSSLG